VRFIRCFMLRDVGSNKHSLIEVSFKSESGKCGQTGQSMAGIVGHVLVFSDGVLLCLSQASLVISFEIGQSTAHCIRWGCSVTVL
jgi:hypothetical protein